MSHSLELTNKNLDSILNECRETITVVRAYEDNAGKSHLSRSEAILANLKVELNRTWEEGGFEHIDDVRNADENDLTYLYAMGKLAEQMLRQQGINKIMLKMHKD